MHVSMQNRWYSSAELNFISFYIRIAIKSAEKEKTTNVTDIKMNLRIFYQTCNTL